MTSNDVGSQPDLQQFWTAVELSAVQRLPLVTLLTQYYFSRASPALKQYIRWSGLNAERLTAAFQEHTAYFLALQTRADELAPLLNGEVELLVSRLRYLLPDAVAAQVHLLMGDFSCAGTVAPRSILLGLEFLPRPACWHLAPPGLPLLGETRFPAVLAHELIHVQQLERTPLLATNLPGFTVLQLALLEGAAEYVGWLLSGQHANPAVHLFGQVHAADLWPAFWEDAAAPSSASGEWFYSAPQHGDWPRDLGYFMGYELCRSYHERHTDKPDVVLELVQGFQNPERFRQNF